MELYPKNTISEFTVALKEPIRLDTNYEVALVEMSYKHSWSIKVGKLYIELVEPAYIDTFDIVFHDGEHIRNFANRLNGELHQFYIQKEYDRRFDLKEKNLTEENTLLPLTKYAVTSLDFRVIEQIKSLPWIKSLPTFMADPFKFIMYLPSKARIRFDGKITTILNLEEKWYQSSEQVKWIYSGTIDDPNPNIIQSLFIYCDIIDYQYVGDAYVPLLRNVVVENSFPKTAIAHYDNPHYVTINKSEINSIHVEIRDDTGEKIKFDQGKVIIKLHFRPKRL
jgi:hypothetical protein